MTNSNARPSFIALDDDSESLRQMSAVLTPFYNVLTTSDPRRALGWIQNEPSVAVIAVEQVLRSGLGIDVLDQVRQLKPDVRRILMTAFTDLASIVDGLHSGAIHKMITKPFVRGELVAALLPAHQQTQNERAAG